MLKQFAINLVLLVGLSTTANAAECPNPSPLDSDIWRAFSIFVELEYQTTTARPDQNHIAFGHALGRLAAAGRGDPVRQEAIECVILALDQVSHLTWGGVTLDDTRWKGLWKAAMGMHDDIVAAEFGVTDMDPAEAIFVALGVASAATPVPVAPAPTAPVSNVPAGPSNVASIDVWSADDYPIPRAGVMHPCGDPDIPALAFWQFYAPIYGGDGTRFYEKRDFICYGNRSYETYAGAFEAYQCDENWMNCARTDETPTPITNITLDGDKTSYSFAGGWGNRYDLMATNTQAPADAIPQACPRIADNAAEPGTRITCLCDAADTRSGAIWGNVFYTSDSNICRAALHAGVIGSSGGEITFMMEQGQPNYDGVTRNGVTSGGYGAYGESFVFQRSQ